MRKTPITLAMLATLATFTPVVHADVTYSFSNLSLGGFEFVQMFGPGVGLLTGTLTSVSINATLNASVDYTYADDLTIYVDPLPLDDVDGLLQVGGFTDLRALERHSWANGGSSAPGTTVIDTVAISSPITFSGSSQPAVWLGNGYRFSESGTWTGSVTLRFADEVAAVPEPSTFAMMALGGLGLAGWASRRRKKAAAAATA